MILPDYFCMRAIDVTEENPFKKLAISLRTTMNVQKALSHGLLVIGFILSASKCLALALVGLSL
jgi:hypothetical protein